MRILARYFGGIDVTDRELLSEKSSGWGLQGRTMKIRQATHGTTTRSQATAGAASV